LKKTFTALIKGINKEEIPLDLQQLFKNLLNLGALNLTDNTYTLNSKYKIGTIDIATSGIGFLSAFGDKLDKDLLIESNDLQNANRGDIVLAKRVYNKSRKRAKAKVILILKRAHDFSIIYTKTLRKRIVGVNLSTTLTCEIKETQKSLKLLPKNTVLKINNETNKITEVLGVLSDSKVDEKISLALFEKKDFFSKESELEAKSHGDSVDKSLYPNRVDLTHLPFCTIDPVDAKDFDDAVYFDIKENAIYVAIADVSEYVYEMGYIDKEARNKGFSIYFPHKSIPMLPRSLSENICSLKPNVDRLAFVFKITLDNNAKPIKEELFDAIINSKKRYTYEQIDTFLEDNLSKKDETDKEIFTFLSPLNQLTKKLKKIRLENGFEFRSTEIRMRLDSEQNLISTRIEKSTRSHGLVEDCMLLANQAAAKKLKVGIFRSHEDPSLDKIQSLLENLLSIRIDVDYMSDIPKMIRKIQKKADGLGIREEVDKLIIRSQKKAKYTSSDDGHFGLGFSQYTHFTSPIRRYSDLILHRLLKAKMKKDEKRFSFLLKDIDDICEQISFLERESDKVAWDFMDRKFARWADLHVGKDFEAIITGVDRNTIAKLDDEIKGARLFVLDDDMELFERVLVKIVEADIVTCKIFVKVVQRDV
jgi:ribonuclease R